MKKLFVIMFLLFPLLAIDSEASSIRYCREKWKDNHTMFDRCLREKPKESAIYTVEYDPIHKDGDEKDRRDKVIKECVIKWIEFEEQNIVAPIMVITKHYREEKL